MFPVTQIQKLYVSFLLERGLRFRRLGFSRLPAAWSLAGPLTLSAGLRGSFQRPQAALLPGPRGRAAESRESGD